MRVVVTGEQRRRERAIFMAFFLDCLIIPLQFWVGTASGSLTMVGEASRGVPLITIAIVSWLMLRRHHRGRTGAFEYGLGKVEQLLALAVSGLLLVAALVIAWRAWTKTSVPPPGIGTLELAAVGLTIANFFVNSLPLIPLLRSARDGFSVTVRTQLRSKFAKTVGSVFVVAAVAVHQFTSDPALALAADRIGAAIVVLVTLHAAIELMRGALPDLLDRTLGEAEQRRINRALAESHEEYESLEWCRCRRAGDVVEVSIGLGFAADRAFADVDRAARTIEARLAAGFPNARVTVTPRRVSCAAT